MIPLWKGIANTWDCDEMGHMNVRIYLEKALEGLGALAGNSHLSHVFKPNAPSTLVPLEQHVRFMREVHPGRPLSMDGCVLEVGENTATIYQELRHGDGSIAAAFRTKLAHCDAINLKPFSWSDRSRQALESLRDTPPKETAPRGLDMDKAPLPNEQVTKAIADEQGVKTIGMGLVPPEHCDAFGRMRFPVFIGRISDAVPNLLHDWREKVSAGVEGRKMGAAVLENRMVYRRWPRAGDLLEVRSCMSSAQGKTHNLVHWVLDPVTGQPWMTSEVVAVTFDQVTRKAIATPPDLLRDLEKIAPGELDL